MQGTTSFRRAKDAVQAVGSGQGDWQDVLRTARDFLGAEGATLLCHDKQSHQLRFMEQAGHDEKVIRDYAEHFFQFDDSTARHWQALSCTWFDSAEHVLVSENDHVFWNDFMRPNQLGQLTGVVICNDDDVLMALSIQRTRIAMPTFAHAARVMEYGRLLNQAFVARRETTRYGLSMLGHVFDCTREGYLVASADGWVLDAMSGIDVLLGGDSHLTIRAHRLMHRIDEWHGRLRACIVRVATTGQPTVLTMPDGWGRSCRLTLRPAEREFNQGLRVGVGVRIERRNIFDVPCASALGDLFSLSQAEARLCHHLVAGLTIDDCSRVLGVSTNTLRKQLTSILRKTGCTRQSDLVRLAASL